MKWVFLLFLFPCTTFGAGSIVFYQGGGTFTMNAGNGNLIMTREYDPPLDFRIVGVSSFSVSADWTAQSFPTATSYTLQVSSNPDFSGTVTSSVTALTVSTVTALLASTSYYAHVKATYVSNDSAFSQSRSTLTLVAPATFVLVQSSCSRTGGTDSLSLRLLGVVAGANRALIVMASDSGNAMSTGQVLSTPSEPTFTMTNEGGKTNGTSGVGMWVSTGITNGGTVIATVTISGAGISMCMAEVSGVTAVDRSTNATGASVTVNAGSMTTTTPTIFFGAMSKNGTSGTSITEVNAETLIGEQEDNTTQQCYSFVYKTQAAATTDFVQWTISSDTWLAVAAALKP